MKLIKLVVIIMVSTGLVSCAKVLPLNYKNYDGGDAATLYVLNRQGNVGTIYLASYTYNAKDSCYDMSDRYELVSNFFQAKGAILVSKVKPGVHYSISQMINFGEVIQKSNTSLIPESGKSYYISSGSSAVQIPASFVPNTSENPDEIIRKYDKDEIKYWNVKNICVRHFWLLS